MINRFDFITMLYNTVLGDVKGVSLEVVPYKVTIRRGGVTLTISPFDPTGDVTPIFASETYNELFQYCTNYGLYKHLDNLKMDDFNHGVVPHMALLDMITLEHSLSLSKEDMDSVNIANATLYPRHGRGIYYATININNWSIIVDGSENALVINHNKLNSG